MKTSAGAWKTVSVFLSSTFNDMHAERDYLVKRLFPKLRHWCEERRLRFVDIDLRWGVTEADATRNKRVVEVCLKRIDECRPFFICLLGQRSGWLPTRDDVPASEGPPGPAGGLSTLDWSSLHKAVDEGRSVTALEVMHALLRPFHRQNAPEALRLPADHAFFYLRDDAYLKDLPKMPGELAPPGDGETEPSPFRRTYTDDDERDQSLRKLKKDRLEELRDTCLNKAGRPARTYTANWSNQARTPELELPLECPFDLEDDSGIQTPGAARWQRIWREWASVTTQGQAVAEADREKARQFNKWLTTGRLTDFTCSLEQVRSTQRADLPEAACKVWEEGLADLARRFPKCRAPLGEVICLDLMTAIAARHPERMEVQELDALQREIAQHEEFVDLAASGYIEREGDFEELDKYADGPSQGLFVLVAPAGLGKSSRLARWVQRRRTSAHPNEEVVCRFIGVGDRSGTVDGLLRDALLELKSLGRIAEKDTELREPRIPDDPKKLRERWLAVLAESGAKGPTVLVFDALNQLQTGLSDRDWLPRELPAGVKLIVSFKLGDKEADDLRACLSTPANTVEGVRPFAKVEDRRKLVTVWLSRYLKELDDRHMDALVGTAGPADPTPSSSGAGRSVPREIENEPPPPAANPLFLKIVLSELRVFGSFTHLGETIGNTYGDTPLSAFKAVLRRLEKDPSDSAVPLAKAVPLVFGLLAHSRGGLPEDLLARILLQELSSDLDAARVRPDHRREVIDDTIQLILRQVRPFLARREGRTDFFYESFRDAARERYTTGNGPGWRTRAEWHGMLAAVCRHWGELGGAAERYALGNVVCHLVHAGDSRTAGLLLTQFEHHYSRLRRLQCEGTTGVLEDFAEVLEAGGGALPVEADNGAVAHWHSFYRAIVHKIRRRVPGVAPEVCLLQTALSEPCGSPSRESAEAWLRRTGPDSYWLRTVRAVRRSGQNRPLATLEGHTAPVRAIALHPDGVRAITGAEDGTVRVWSIRSALCLRTLTGHAGEVTAVSVHLDGRQAVSAGADGTLRVWDLEKGACLMVMRGHALRVTAATLHPDGRRLVSASEDQTIKLWDLQTGDCLQTLSGHTGCVNTLAIQRSGKRLVSGSDDHTLRVWDLAGDTPPRIIAGHGDRVAAVSLDADGRRATSAGGRCLKLWDLETEECIQWTDPGVDEILAATMLPDGDCVVVCGGEFYPDVLCALGVWDLSTGVVRWAVAEHTSPVRAVALLPSGQQVLWGDEADIRIQDLSGSIDAPEPLDHADNVRAVAINAGCTLGASGGDDGSVVVWDARTGERKIAVDGCGFVSAIAFHPDGRRVVWTTNRFRRRRNDSIGRPGVFMYDLDSCLCDALFASEACGALALHPDGHRALVAGTDDTIEVWDIATRALLRTMTGHTDWLNGVALHPGGSWAVSAAGGQYERDCTVKVWDIDSGKCLRTMEGHSGRVNAVATDPAGRLVVSASRDKSMKYWDVGNARCLETVSWHTDSVEAVAFSPDGEKVASVSADQTLRVWRARTDDCLAAWLADSEITCCSWGRDRIMAGTASGEILILEFLPPGPWSAQTAG
jgi:WD40 repeat protein